jgi:hypothetical protein
MAKEPDGLDGDEEEKAWMEGMNILNEIATETLALDILKGISKSETKSITSETVRLLSKLPGATPELVGIPKAEEYLTDMMTNDDYDEFKKRLATAMLLGDTTKVESFLIEKELDNLDSIALQLSKKTKYGGKALRDAMNKPRLAKALKKIRFPIGGGCTSISYPGVLSMHIIPAIRNPQSIPRDILHEICHYISNDINHLGLFKGEYKRTPDA